MMTKTISLKLLFVVAFAVVMLFVAQFVFTPARAQAPGNLIAAPPVSVESAASAQAPTAAELEQIKKVAEALPVQLLLSVQDIKTILALAANSTAQVSVLERTTSMGVPVIFEKNDDKKYGSVYCGYLSDDIAVNGKPAPRIAVMKSGLAAQILDVLRGGRSSIVLFDSLKYPTSFGCIRGLTAAAPVLISMSLNFPASIVSSVLAQSGAELIAQAKAAQAKAACPKNITMLAQRITAQKNPSVYINQRAALKANLVKSKNFRNCDLEAFLPAVPPIPPSTGKGKVPTVLYDFGDAPAPYPTTLAEGGIRHRIGSVWLGVNTLSEGGSQALAVDDEGDALRSDRDRFDDGLALTQVQTVPPPPDSVRVTRAAVLQGSKGRPLPAAFLNVLDDVNGNGQWEPAEWVVQNQIVSFTADTQTVGLRNPSNQPVILSRKGVARITVTTGRLQNYRGRAPNNQPLSGGETEDYIWRGGSVPPVTPPDCPAVPAVQCAPGTVPQQGPPDAQGCPAPTTCVPSGTPTGLLDFGDAALGFPTLLSENGPRHRLSNRVWLGDLIDAELDGLRTNRDDTTEVNDEDGMLNSNPFVLLVRTGPQVLSTVYVNAWEDWNRNNRWDINANGAPGDEWIVRNQPVNVRPNSVQNAFLVQPRNGPDGRPLPAAWSDPAAWVRFMVTEARISNGRSAFTSAFNSGETEDYIGVPAPVPGGSEQPAPAGGGAGGGNGGAAGAGAAAGHD